MDADFTPPWVKVFYIRFVSIEEFVGSRIADVACPGLILEVHCMSVAFAHRNLGNLLLWIIALTLSSNV